MPRAFFNDSFNDIHELKYGQAEEKLEAGGDEKLIFNFIWPNHATFMTDTLDATFVTSILFVCANGNVCPGSTMHLCAFQVLHKLWSTLIK